MMGRRAHERHEAAGSGSRSTTRTSDRPPALLRRSEPHSCGEAARPCPRSSCRYHLPRGRESCALDVADRGGATLEHIGEMLGITRERVRQIEAGALDKLRRRAERFELEREDIGELAKQRDRNGEQRS